MGLCLGDSGKPHTFLAIPQQAGESDGERFENIKQRYMEMSLETESDTVKIQRLTKELTELQHKYDTEIFNQSSYIKFPKEFVAALNLVFDEIEYQNDKWGEEHNRNQSVEGHLLVLEEELLEARKGWAKNLTGRNSVESEITQVAAVAIQALVNLQQSKK